MPTSTSYRGVATGPTIDRIAALDFVLFVEMIQRTFAHHDQSMPLIDADLIRPGTPLGLTRFGAATVTVGILDTGFMIGDAAPVMHWDLDKNACGLNFTTDAAGTFHDENGHGTHVLATIVGTGTVRPPLSRHGHRRGDHRGAPGRQGPRQEQERPRHLDREPGWTSCPDSRSARARRRS